MSGAIAARLSRAWRERRRCAHVERRRVARVRWVEAAAAMLRSRMRLLPHLLPHLLLRGLLRGLLLLLLRLRRRRVRAGELRDRERGRTVRMRAHVELAATYGLDGKVQPCSGEGTKGGEGRSAAEPLRKGGGREISGRAVEKRGGREISGRAVEKRGGGGREISGRAVRWPKANSARAQPCAPLPRGRRRALSSRVSACAAAPAAPSCGAMSGAPTGGRQRHSKACSPR